MLAFPQVSIITSHVLVIGTDGENYLIGEASRRSTHTVVQCLQESSPSNLYFSQQPWGGNKEAHLLASN